MAFGDGCRVVFVESVGTFFYSFQSMLQKGLAIEYFVSHPL